MIYNVVLVTAIHQHESDIDVCICSGFSGDSEGKELACNAGNLCSILGRDYLEKEMATHSNILAWRIPWTEETGGLQSMRSQRIRHDWVINSNQTDVPSLLNLPLVFLFSIDLTIQNNNTNNVFSDLGKWN